ncbi:MAG: RNA polymerase factor sigma-54 [Alphaproteobacteria bacterium]|nr:RNA polymerase factor sigma-54 [Alphaproteobacteria bacterium]
MSAPRLELRQGQSLVMTQALQQSIKLLQCNALELREFIEAELEKNPLLQAEEGEIKESTAEDADTPKESDEPRETDFGDDQSFDAGSFDDTETDYIRGDSSLATRSSVASGDEDGLGIDDNASPEISLREHLLNQLQIDITDPMERMIGAHLIDLVDDAGYITQNLGQLASALDVEQAELERVLAKLQGFDPTGVCARNLSECLAIQLREKNHLDPAMECLLQHLHLLGDGKFDELQKKCGVDRDDLKEMIGEIKALNPKPGSRFEHEIVQHMEPDIFVRRLPDGNWHVELNMGNFPRVMVNKRYYKKVTAETKNQQDKKYLSEQLMSANWLVRALEQRAETMLKVGSELVKQQDAFFRLGVRYLKPMTLKDIAAATDYHESTISRVTSGKYLLCPRGTFELKYFFTSALQRSIGGGDDVSSMAVKNYISEFISKESIEHILSDDEIVAMLKDRNITVARRTVAKYREALDIPASPKRKRLKCNSL